VTEALGRSQGGFSTKVHIRAEGKGKLMTIALTPGQRHEATAFETLMQQGAVKRNGPGRPRLRPLRIVGDKGYSSGKIRRYLRTHGIRITIPHRCNEHCSGPFDKQLYRQRNRVERLINRLKHCRRLATRYDKRADTYRTFWIIAATIEWLSFAYTT
jgi:transposase